MYTNLTEGDTYLYFDSVVQFQHGILTNLQTSSVKGKSTFSAGTAGQTTVNTGEGDQCGFQIQALVDHSAAAKIEKFVKLDNRLSGGTIKARYLVRQYASTTFREFPLADGTLKKYAQVTSMIYDSMETIEKGQYQLLVTLTLAEVQP